MSYEITKADLQEIGERVKQIQKLYYLHHFSYLHHLRTSLSGYELAFPLVSCEQKIQTNPKLPV